jgi:probable F420-dependent oxidoreductase
MTSIVPDGPLAYGMQLQIQSQSRLYAEDWEASAGAAELGGIARKADGTGFFYVAVCDHVAVPRPYDERMGGTWYDTVATLGWLAAQTSNVRLLSHVFVVAYRHPLVSAKSFMTLDELSGGRAVLGVGAGHVEPEFDLLGVPFADRGRLTDEAIDEIRAALDHEYVHDAAMAPRPRQAHVPIWIGGSSKPAMRRAAVRGDGWLPQGPPAEGMEAGIAFIRAEREKAGRGDDPIDLGGLSDILYVGEPSWELRPTDRSGKPEEIAEHLLSFKALGCNHVQVRFRNRSLDELLDQMDAFASEVAPLL